MKNPTVYDVINSQVFASEVNSGLKEIRNKIHESEQKYGRLKSNPYSQLINDGQFNVEFMVNEYARLLLKQSTLPSSKRNVIGHICTLAYNKSLPVIINENNKADGEAKNVLSKRKNK